MSLEERFLNIQHRFNPLHVYCRLIDRGLKKRTAIAISRSYEILVYWLIKLVSIAGVLLIRRFRRPLLVVMSLFLLLLLFAVPIWAADVTLGWDANTEADLAGYRIYQAEITGNVSTAWVIVAEVPAGTETCVVTVDEKKNWTWYATAYDQAGNESQASNSAFMIDRIPPGKMKNFHK